MESCCVIPTAAARFGRSLSANRAPEEIWRGLRRGQRGAILIRDDPSQGAEGCRSALASVQADRMKPAICTVFAWSGLANAGFSRSAQVGGAKGSESDISPALVRLPLNQNKGVYTGQFQAPSPSRIGKVPPNCRRTLLAGQSDAEPVGAPSGGLNGLDRRTWGPVDVLGPCPERAIWRVRSWACRAPRYGFHVPHGSGLGGTRPLF